MPISRHLISRLFEKQKVARIQCSNSEKERHERREKKVSVDAKNVETKHDDEPLLVDWLKEQLVKWERNWVINMDIV